MFTYKNGDFGAISVTESGASHFAKVLCHLWCTVNWFSAAVHRLVFRQTEVNK